MTKKINKEDIDRIYDNDIDVTNRVLYLFGEIDVKAAEKIIKGLHILESSATTENNPITLVINTEGGAVDSGMAIFGVIKSCKNTVTIKMLGEVCSMGTIIALACDNRLIDPNCRYMIHYGSAAFDDTQKTVQKSSDETKKLDFITENIYIEAMLKKDKEMADLGYPQHLEQALADIVNEQRSLEYPLGQKPIKYKWSSDITKKKEDIRIVLKVLLNNDTFLSAEETISLGFADALIEYTSF